jgi:hypothetical protein
VVVEAWRWSWHKFLFIAAAIGPCAATTERRWAGTTRIAIAIVLMRFAFRIGNHFGFSDGADDDL